MKTILVAVNLAEPYTRLIKKARSVANVYNARLRLVYVAPPDPSFVGAASWPQIVRDGFASELKEEHNELRSIADGIREHGVECESFMVRGHVVDVLLEQIEKSKPEMVILGSHEEGGLFQALSGGVVRGVLRRGKCPVLVVPLPEPAPEESACADDGSAEERQAGSDA